MIDKVVAMLSDVFPILMALGVDANAVRADSLACAASGLWLALRTYSTCTFQALRYLPSPSRVLTEESGDLILGLSVAFSNGRLDVCEFCLVNKSV